ncbi:hypothetical protein [Nonomuraea dietziae]|uniref:hypothetical protein n=1 Tax=Nonomuraea dietziae TaxID=65515 RepID=UPI0033C3A19D
MQGQQAAQLAAGSRGRREPSARTRISPTQNGETASSPTGRPASRLRSSHPFRALNVTGGKVLPSNVAVLEGKVQRGAKGEAALAEARAERLQILEEINRHAWWEGTSNRHGAWVELNKAERS